MNRRPSQPSALSISILSPSAGCTGSTFLRSSSWSGAGLLIYWADSTPPDGDHLGQVYRIGIGHWTLLRLFPDGFYTRLNITGELTRGLGWHFFFMWIFAVNGIAYVAYLVLSGEWRLLVPDRRSIVDAIQVTLHDLHIRRGLPSQKKYNGAQRIAYTMVIVMGLGSLVTGLAIYKPTQAHWFTTLLGGYEMARWLHIWLDFGFSVFFLVHVVQVILAGWNNFRAMVSGREVKPVGEPSLDAEKRAELEAEARCDQVELIRKIQPT